MLSDDITTGMSAILTGAGRVLTGALRGAILFGLIALVLGAAVAAWPCVSTAGVLVGITTFVSGLISNIFSATALAWAGYGAIGGAAVMGATSIIPGKAEGLGVGKMAASVAQAPAQVFQKALEPQRAPQIENYAFEEGRGAAMAKKGDCTEATMVKS